VRTFSDWEDPPPGFIEADLVAHSGPVASGSFIQTLVLTDIATGWTECAPLLVREQTVLVEVLSEVRKLLPFELLGFDTDNDTVFMNETVRDYCQVAGIEFTRCRPYRKNDQAWVEQKNGAIVRRIVSYRRYEGLEAAAELARLYATVRLFINFFQPSFKLAGKQREGAKVSRQYHAPATPYARLLATGKLEAMVEERLVAEFMALDPISLLAAMRSSQERIASLVALGGNADPPAAVAHSELAGFLSGLGTAWQAGEVRATHRKPPKARRYWRSRLDPFAAVAADLRSWFEAAPDLQATDLLVRLEDEYPGQYPGKLLRTLQRRVRGWRRELAHHLVFGTAAAETAPAQGKDIDAPYLPPSGAAQPACRAVGLLGDAAAASPTAL
jgi:hypothetical protein